MREIQFLFILLITFFSSCNKQVQQHCTEDNSCRSGRIISLEVTNYPTMNEEGESWDDNFGLPDLKARISVYGQEEITTYAMIDGGGTWHFAQPIEFDSLGTYNTISVRFYDEDAFGVDEYMGGISFSVLNYYGIEEMNGYNGELGCKMTVFWD